jgi:diadenosine tetraphosphate (Ap4A) HIT family hydrolase
VPETPEELYRRVQRDGLRRPAVEEWETFPFAGHITVRDLEAPVAGEKPRVGEAQEECWRCREGEGHAIWSDERWIVTPFPEPSGLPVVVFLFPREHVDIDGLPEELARELGPMLLRVERAVRSVGEIGRVHVCRWGDGSYHLHWWFLARPARIPQLIGSFAAIWDDVLPPTPEEVWRENLAAVARALAQDGGRAHV